MSLDPTCPNDDTPIKDAAFLCHACGRTLQVALGNIIDLWPELNTTLTRQSRTRSSGTRVEKPSWHDTESAIPNEDPLPVNMAASDAVWAIRNTITTWARDMIESTGWELPEPSAPDLEVTNSRPRCPVVPADEVQRAALLLMRNVQWWRHRQVGPDFMDDVLAAENLAKRTVDTANRDSMVIGACPVQWPDEDDQMTTCGGEVRAWPTPEGVTLVERKTEARLPKCMRCGTEADVSWWQGQMMPEIGEQVTATELIGIVAFELHWTITHDQIRQWVHREKIAKVGKDTRGRSLYDWRAVVSAIRADIEAARAG